MQPSPVIPKQPSNGLFCVFQVSPWGRPQLIHCPLFHQAQAPTHKSGKFGCICFIASFVIRMSKLVTKVKSLAQSTCSGRTECLIQPGKMAFPQISRQIMMSSGLGRQYKRPTWVMMLVVTLAVRDDVRLTQRCRFLVTQRGAVSFVTGRGMAVHDGGSVNRRHLGGAAEFLDWFMP